MIILKKKENCEKEKRQRNGQREGLTGKWRQIQTTDRVSGL